MKKLLNGQYFGGTLKSKTINGIILTEKIHPTGEKLPVHRHINAYFCNILGGHWIEKLDDKERECKPLKSIYHPPEETHSDHFEEKGHTFNIEFNKARMDQYLNISTSLSYSNEFYNDEINVISMKILSEFHCSDIFSDIAIEGLTLEMIAGTARKFTPKKIQSIPGWLNRVEEILREQCDNQTSLKQIGDEIGVHPVHISRSFRKVNGCTLGDYRRKLKIDNARIKLQTKNSTIAEVAMESGFYDQSHFSRIFKKFVGITPREYKRCFGRS